MKLLSRSASRAVISFCIPAHNEERLLPATLVAINNAARELSVDFEIVVANDSSTDGTTQAALAGGARIVQIDSRQIAAARNAAARAACGDILFFIDADTRIHTSAVAQALALLESGCVGGGAVPRFDGHGPLWANLLLGCLLIPYRMASFAAGAFMFCTREAFERSGGFDERLFAGEEVSFAIALKRVGRFRLIRDRVLTSGRKVRAYSMREVIGTVGRAMLKGPRAVTSRDGLEMWYGPRRPDPDNKEISK